MALEIQQGFEYQEKDWWKWWVWIEGPDDELDQIDHVDYMLHPTFHNPVRTVTDRKSKFRLKTSGWGGFCIKATAILKGGEKIRMKHDLVLEYQDGTAATA
jgi:transcription initiation factor IIF auxiliary subunit